MQTVKIGFAAFQDGTFELIVKDEKTLKETTLKGKLEPGQAEFIDKIFPSCVFVRANLT